MKGIIAFFVLLSLQVWFWAEGPGFNWLQAGKNQWLLFMGTTFTAFIIAWLEAEKKNGKITGKPGNIAGSDSQGFWLLSRFWSIFIGLLVVLTLAAYFGLIREA